MTVSKAVFFKWLGERDQQQSNYSFYTIGAIQAIYIKAFQPASELWSMGAGKGEGSGVRGGMGVVLMKTLKRLHH